MSVDTFSDDNRIPPPPGKEEDAAGANGRSVNTGGGAYVGGDVHTAGGTFISRDQVIYVGYSAAEVERIVERTLRGQETQTPPVEMTPTITRQPFEPETLPIPAGPFLMGSDDPNLPPAEQPQHTIHLPDFRMGKYPVKVCEYAAFIKDKKDHPEPQGWFNREPPPEWPPDRLNHPVTDVSWHDALAYCAWLSERCKPRIYTLPSEAEWERSCGQDGVEAMLGSVQQWTRSLWGTRPQQPEYGYPYDPADGREISDPAKLPAQAWLVHRGGSHKSPPAHLRCAARSNAPPHSKIAWRGLRVVMQLEKPK